MEKKQNGILQKMIREIYKFRFVLVFLTCFFCKGQENDILNKPFLVEIYSDKISTDEDLVVFESKKLNEILNENSKYFIQKGWQKTSQNNNIVTELLASNESDLSKIKSKTSTKYLFITQNNILKDTLKINKNFEYSICQLDKQNTKNGLAIGKYKINGKREYFEIHQLFQIDNEGKIRKMKISTIIFDCPAPTDYIKDEEPDSYTFGILGGKKLNRYWFENSSNN